jgi:hypothetical protein
MINLKAAVLRGKGVESVVTNTKKWRFDPKGNVYASDNYLN